MTAGESTIGRQVRAAVAGILIVGVLLGGAYGVFRLTIGRPTLAGARHHDFGVVELVDRAVTLEHTFVLTNRGREPIEIVDLKTSCGCTVADPSTNVVAAGADVRIAATLTMKDDVRKQAKIYVRYGDDEVDVLYLEATARLRQRLTAAGGPARLEPGQAIERVIFMIDYDSNDPPPAPRIEAPAGVAATFTEWSPVQRRRASTGSPARWRGRVRLERDAGAAPPGEATPAEVIIAASGQEIRIPLDLATAASGGPEGG